MLAPVKTQIWKRAKGGVPGTRNDQRPSEVDNRDKHSDEQVIGDSPLIAMRLGQLPV